MDNLATQKVGEAYRKWFTERGIPTENFNFKEAIAELDKQCRIDNQTVTRILGKIQQYMQLRAQKSA